MCVSERMLCLCTCVDCVCVHMCMQQFIRAVVSIGVCPYVSATVNALASWCCVYVYD